MEKKRLIIAYLSIVVSAIVGIGEILTYVILKDMTLASILIAALAFSLAFAFIHISNKSPHLLLGTVLPYLIITIVYLAIGYGSKAHWIFYFYDVGIFYY